MSISFILCMAKNRVIGANNKLPWRLPAEMAYFRQTTMGKTVLMGRKTFESLRKPLEGRKNVVLTRNVQFAPEGCEVVHTVEEALIKYGQDDMMIIGGAEVYNLFLPYADQIYLTVIDQEFQGDAYFPELDADQWRIVSARDGVTDEKNPYRYTFYVYERTADKEMN